MPELCDDGIDNNCDGNIDENCVLDPCHAINLFITAITQDTSRAKQLLESDVNISNTQDIVFRAGDEIMLLPNFEVAQGAEFLAEIKDCEVQTTSIVFGPATANAITDYIKNKSLAKGYFTLYNKYGEGLIENAPKLKLEQLLTTITNDESFILIINPN